MTEPWWRNADEAVLRSVSSTMRMVDAYAYDYAKDGKLAATRAHVEEEIALGIIASVAMERERTADQLRAAIAQERDRCARVCDEQVKAISDEGESRCAMVAGMCAAAIRGQAEGERG